MKTVQKYYAAFTALIVFLIYLVTLCPSIAPIDAGELATVQILPGVAHPTGYPLFTIIGYLFSLLPLFASKIYQMNFLASIWSALAIYFFIKSSELMFKIRSVTVEKKITKKKKGKKSKKGKEKRSEENSPLNLVPDSVKFFSILTGALSLAFSRTFWQQSNSVEVYSFQTFLFALIIFSILKTLENGFTESPLKQWLFVAAALALGFSNHMTTLLILPGLAYVYFVKEKFNKASFIKIGWMLVLFFTILILLYLYIPLEAIAKPLLNWGDATNWEKFWRHFTGKQYQVWLFSSVEAAKKQFAYYIGNFPSEFGYAVWLLGLVGLLAAYKQSKKLFWFITLNFLFTVLYAINYDIHDIDSYFLLSYFSVSFFVIFGTVRIFTAKNVKFYFTGGIVILLLIAEAVTNFPEANKNDYYVLEDYTNSILNSVETNSIIFTYQWDYFVSPSYYLQLVEKRRKDVTVVDKELLRRSWYYNQLQTRDANILRGVEPFVKEFKKALVPFERGDNYDANLLEKYYRAIMTGLVAKNFPQRSFYILPELVDNEMRNGEFQLPKGLSLVPEWFGYKVIAGNKYTPAESINFKIRFPKRSDHYSKFVKNLISEMLAKRALYELSFNKGEKAKLFTKKLQVFNPDFIIPSVLLENLNRH